jgi:uncharacterized iron-regulated membrane protein
MTFHLRAAHALRRLHGRIGAFAAIFFLFLVVSGLALNHSDALKLDQQAIGTTWLLAWYGIERKPPMLGYRLGDGYFVSEGDGWLLNGRRLPGAHGNPVGAVTKDDIYFIATPGSLHLYRGDGQLVDRLDARALPGVPIERIGIAAGRVVLQTPVGQFASADAIQWQRVTGTGVAGSTQGPLPPQVREEAARLLAPTLPLQRVLLDLHSGRIFGRYGPLLVDLLAVALGLLAASGLWMHWRAAHRKAQHEAGKR